MKTPGQESDGHREDVRTLTKRAMVCLLLVIILSSSLGVATQASGKADFPIDMTEETLQPVFSVVRYSHPTSEALQSARDQRKEDQTMGEFKLVIDRFEGSWAVVEYDGETFDMPRSLLPAAAKEGDTLTLTLRVDPSDTAERKKKIENLIDDLFL
jgi:hypothetical protein